MEKAEPARQLTTNVLECIHCARTRAAEQASKYLIASHLLYKFGLCYG